MLGPDFSDSEFSFRHSMFGNRFNWFSTDDDVEELIFSRKMLITDYLSLLKKAPISKKFSGLLDSTNQLYSYFLNRTDAKTIGDVCSLLRKGKVDSRIIDSWMRDNLVSDNNPLDNNLSYKAIKKGYPIHTWSNDLLKDFDQYSRKKKEDYEQTSKTYAELLDREDKAAFQLELKLSKKSSKNLTIDDFLSEIDSHSRGLDRTNILKKDELFHVNGIYKYLAKKANVKTLEGVYDALVDHKIDTNVLELFISDGYLDTIDKIDGMNIHQGILKGYPELLMQLSWNIPHYSD